MQTAVSHSRLIHFTRASYLPHLYVPSEQWHYHSLASQLLLQTQRTRLLTDSGQHRELFPLTRHQIPFPHLPVSSTRPSRRPQNHDFPSL